MDKRRSTGGDCQDRIDRVPDECISHIFAFLPDPVDRSSCSFVSKKWLNILASMSSSEFLEQSIETEEDVSVCLDGDRATDTILAAVLVLRKPTELTVRASRFSSPTNGITDTALEIIARACPQLKTLVLWNCPRVTDAGLAAVAKGCRSLQKLDLLNNRSIGNYGLSAIAAHCHCLTALTLESCPLIGYQPMAALAKHASRLASVNVVGCPRIGDDGILALASLPELVDFKLGKMRIGDAVLRAIGESVVRSVRFDNVIGPSEAGYSWIGARGEIESLALQSCVGLGSESFKPTRENSFSGLKRVSIRDCSSLTDECLLELTGRARSLESLTLESCSGGLTCGGLIRAIANCSKTLKMLSLVKCNFIIGENSIITSVHEDCPQLSTLKLVRCGGVTADFFEWLGSGCACRQAKHVAVTGMGDFVTNRVILELLRTHEGCIESLDLSGCVAVGDRCMLAIAGVFGKKLKLLRLRGCSGLSERFLGEIGELCPELRELDLSGCAIGDAGLMRLLMAAPAKLQVMSLAGCSRITDRGVDMVCLTCCGLDMLNLKHCTGVSKHGVDSIGDALFWCDLIA